tara:strand:- start:397 stop:1503 length:1107 start_codon:yes stop_codon:yes gene_type:complete
MNLSELVNHVQTILPLYTSTLSVSKPITVLSKSGNDVTASCIQHGLNVGQDVFLSGIKTDIAITDITTVNGISTATCATDHDLSYPYINKVKISSPESAYSGDKNITSVPSATTFTFNSTGDPAQSTGTLHTFHSIGFNGWHKVSYIVDANRFQVVLNNDRLVAGSGQDMKLVTSLTISACATIERAIKLYTDKQMTSPFLFIIPDGSDASASRNTQSDANSETTSTDQFYLKLVNNFSIYLIIPTVNDITGTQGIDQAFDLLPALYKTIAGYRPSTFFANSSNTLMVPLGHGVTSYNDAYVVYSYTFETTETILSTQTAGYSQDTDAFMYNSGDTYTNADTVAFRSFDSTFKNNALQNAKQNNFDLL